MKPVYRQLTIGGLVALGVASVVATSAATPAARPGSDATSAANHHCRNEEPLYATKHVVIARELTQASDIYVTCWRKTDKHRVVAKFPAAAHELVGFRIKGPWVVFRYRTASDQRDHMASINARTGHRGPRVVVPAPNAPAALTPTAGPVAQDVGDAGAMFVFIAANGYYAWPVTGQLPDADGGGQGIAIYTPTGSGGDTRLDVAAGINGLRRFAITGSTLRWIKNGTAKRKHLGPSLPQSR